MVPYVILVGVSSFLEKPALRQLDALQLNALVAIGMTSVALTAVLVRDRRIVLRRSTLEGVGIGTMIGAATIAYYLALSHLPVSVAAPLANTYVLVTVLLTIVVWHDTITATKIGAIAAILAGVTLLAVRV